MKLSGTTMPCCCFCSVSSPTEEAAVRARLQVARLENVPGLIGLLRPHAGETIGLQFDPHRHLVRTDAAARRLFFGGCLVGDAQLVLNVMPHLVRDDIGAGELAGRPELRGKLLKEGEVDVHLPVTRTVERAPPPVLARPQAESTE